jgi:hypothetical protein
MFFPGQKRIFLLLRYAHIYLKHVFFSFSHFSSYYLSISILPIFVLFVPFSFTFFLFLVSFFIFLLPLKWLRLIPSVSDPDHFDTHPDPTFQFDTAPDLDPTVGSPEAQSYLAGVQWVLSSFSVPYLWSVHEVEKSKFSTVFSTIEVWVGDPEKWYGSNPDPIRIRSRSATLLMPPPGGRGGMRVFSVCMYAHHCLCF